MDRPPEIGQTLRLNISLPTRFNGMAQLNARLKCEAQDTRLFNFSDENPNTVLVEQEYPVAKSETVTRDSEITRTVELIIPADMPPSTPVDSRERTHTVWSLFLTAEGSGGRKAEMEYILAVVK